MHCTLNKRNLMGIALGLFLVAASPVTAAVSSPPTNVTVPDWLTRIQYPGTSSEPTVYVNGPIAIPAWLARIQYPGTSSQPMVILEGPARREGRTQPVRNGQIAIPAWLARIQYPGTSSEPTVLVSVPRGASGESTLDWASAAVGGGFVAGIALLGAGAVLAFRRRKRLDHVWQ